MCSPQVCYCASHCSDPESYVAAPGLLTVFPGTHTYTTSPEVVYRKVPAAASKLWKALRPSAICGGFTVFFFCRRNRG